MVQLSEWREETNDDEILQSKKSSYMTSTWRYVCDGFYFENYNWLIYLREYHSSFIYISTLHTYTTILVSWILWLQKVVCHLVFATLKFEHFCNSFSLVLSWVSYNSTKRQSGSPKESDCLYYYSTCIAMESIKRLQLKTKYRLKKFQIK